MFVKRRQSVSTSIVSISRQGTLETTAAANRISATAVPSASTAGVPVLPATESAALDTSARDAEVSGLTLLLLYS